MAMSSEILNWFGTTPSCGCALGSQNPALHWSLTELIVEYRKFAQSGEPIASCVEIECVCECCSRIVPLKARFSGADMATRILALRAQTLHF